MEILYKSAVFFIVLSVLVLIHEFGHFFAAKKNGVKVEEFGFGLPPRLFGKRIGETLYSINWLPFGGFVKVFGEETADLEGKSLSESDKQRSFAHKKPWQKISILVAGVVMNFILGWAIMSFLFVRGVPTPSDHVSVESVIPGTPAETAGIMKGDVIISISANGLTRIISDVSDVSEATAEFGDIESTFTLMRGDSQIQINATPRKNPPKDEGSLGIVITNFVIKKYSLIEAPYYGLIESVKTTGIIARELVGFLGKLITLKNPLADVAGPIGIAKLTGQAAQAGIDPLLQLVGILSFNLAVFNILPFPALDGGRLVFVVYEWVTRRQVNPDVERRLNVAGFAILLGLIAIVTISDIVKLFR